MFDLFEYIKNVRSSTWTVPTDADLASEGSASTGQTVTNAIKIPLNGTSSTTTQTTTGNTTTNNTSCFTQNSTSSTIAKPDASGSVFTSSKTPTTQTSGQTNILPSNTISLSTNNTAKGNTIATTTTASDNKTATTGSTTTSTTTDNTQTGTTGKTETMDEFFGRYYKRYNSASEEDKTKMITRYLQSLASSPERQAKAFEHLREKGASPEEIQRLSNTIDKLNSKVQVKAADAVCNKGTEEQNTVGRKVVADNYQNYDKTVQKDVAKIIVETKDENVIKTAASHSAECDKSNQVDIVKTYQQIDNKEVNKVLIDQYKDYAKENQVDIHKVMSNSKQSETVEYAASKIYNFHEDNQAAAAKVTTATGNEAAIKAMAAQLCRFTNRAIREQIKNLARSTNISGIEETLAKAEKEIIKTDSTTSSEQTSESSASQTQTTDSSDDDTSSSTSTNIDNNDEAYAESVKNSSDVEKIEMMNSMPPSELANNLSLFLNGNSSPEVINAAISMLNTLSEQDKMKVISQFQGNDYIKNLILVQLGTLDESTQRLIVNKAAESGSLNDINRSLLAGSVKRDYDKLLEQQNKKQG